MAPRSAANAIVLPSGEKLGDSGSSTDFIATRSSMFRVRTFCTMSVRSFSVRTKYAMRSPLGGLAAADHAFSQREQELPDAFLAEFRFDELEDRVAEVIHEQRVARVSVSFHLRHLRHDIGHGRVANLHQVGRAPLPAFVVRQAL